MLDVKEGIEKHPGHFQPKQCYIPYSETLRNSVKYSKNPVNHPFDILNIDQQLFTPSQNPHAQPKIQVTSTDNTTNINQSNNNENKPKNK